MLQRPTMSSLLCLLLFCSVQFPPPPPFFVSVPCLSVLPCCFLHFPAAGVSILFLSRVRLSCGWMRGGSVEMRRSNQSFLKFDVKTGFETFL